MIKKTSGFLGGEFDHWPAYRHLTDDMRVLKEDDYNLWCEKTHGFSHVDESTTLKKILNF